MAPFLGAIIGRFLQWMVYLRPPQTVDGLDATLKVSSPPKGGSLLTITLEKGKDPKAERQGIVNLMLSVCSKFGTQCTEEKEKQ